MRVINIHEAKTHLSRLLERVASGEDIVIAKAGHPVVRLVPFEPIEPKIAPPGAMEGQIWMADDFDAPLDGLFDCLREPPGGTDSP